ncbi:hypothetical protein [Paenibacillus mucilaginosus]|uniref:Lipoprotein n=1 Tax=Paenibacillus mucilaginosus (strain KNP414) TaxID=1036673 RepID=F8F9S6_PAEMK|nr:hypothetical protein [Paenibacillus mucilaginosus]AEI44405.1 hypothetical protein KNP414_05881 [Paenibacillus mucilaginosus KNP414]MCG7213783.1 hypothetical protein [Paenibacillus mucilaginosus]WDM25795.1 hypothetical protein KCX80_25570 [Paenibacillus mucilaginosus]
MEQHKGSRTRRMVKLFVASTLVLGGAAGCSDSRDCVDNNRDGYCDDGGGGSSSSSHYYYGSSGSSKASSSGTVSGSSSGISKGGIGSSGSSSS